MPKTQEAPKMSLAQKLAAKAAEKMTAKAGSYYCQVESPKRQPIAQTIKENGNWGLLFTAENAEGAGLKPDSRWVQIEKYFDNATEPTVAYLAKTARMVVIRQTPIMVTQKVKDQFNKESHRVVGVAYQGGKSTTLGQKAMDRTNLEYGMHSKALVTFLSDNNEILCEPVSLKLHGGFSKSFGDEYRNAVSSVEGVIAKLVGKKALLAPEQKTLVVFDCAFSPYKTASASSSPFTYVSNVKLAALENGEETKNKSASNTDPAKNVRYQYVDLSEVFIDEETEAGQQLLKFYEDSKGFETSFLNGAEPEVETPFKGAGSFDVESIDVKTDGSILVDFVTDESTVKIRLVDDQVNLVDEPCRYVISGSTVNGIVSITTFTRDTTSDDEGFQDFPE